MAGRRWNAPGRGTGELGSGATLRLTAHMSRQNPSGVQPEGEPGDDRDTKEAHSGMPREGRWPVSMPRGL
jgi:hypothetical protein